MNTDLIFTLLAFSLPIVFALLCLYYAFSLLKTARQLEDTPTSKIRSAAQGYLELSGTLKPLRETKAPLSHRPCAWYRYRIEQLTAIQSHKRTEYYWKTLSSGASETEFLLVDETGECHVTPNSAHVVPSTLTRWRGHSKTGSPLPNSFFKKLFSYWGRYRYTEELLEFDRNIFACGRFITKHDPETQKTIHWLTHEGLENKRFILSGISQEKLIRTLKIRSLGFFVGFIGFAGFSVKNFIH